MSISLKQSFSEIKIKEITFESDAGSIDLVYRLVKVYIPEEIYIISVCIENEIAYLRPISSPEKAKEVFDSIADRTVTPCTVNDILSDMLREEL